MYMYMYRTTSTYTSTYVSNEDAVEFEQVHISTSYMWIRLRLWFYLYNLKPCLQIDYARQTSMGCSTRRSLSCMRTTTVEIRIFSTSHTIYGITFIQSLCLSYISPAIDFSWYALFM